MSDQPPPGVPSSIVDAAEAVHENEQRYVGKCKWFNVSKGFGFIIPDDTEEDIFVHQSELRMDGFRSLEEGERLSFFMRERRGGKGKEAWAVGPEEEGKTLIGSSIRPIGKKKDKLIRCFKCGRFGNHLASRCKKVELSGKVCYNCGSEDHLFSGCPLKSAKKDKGSTAMESAEIKQVE